MGTTNLDWLEVSGVPTIGVGGMLPFTGNYFFIDAANGSDGNTGQADDPLASLDAAYDRCVDGHNDVIFIVGDGSTAATQRLSSQFVFSKDAVHLIGLTAPTMIAQRARISTATGATANINPLVQVTAQGCIFANFSLFQGVGEAATAEKLWQEQGQRNFYGNVDFGGMGGVAGAAHADSYSLNLNGGSENTFKGCHFGTDTRDRDAANCNILFDKNGSQAATRNMFIDCITSMRATDTDPLFINAGGVNCIDRFALFKNCSFINVGTGTLAKAILGNATNGHIVLDNCVLTGATNWAATMATVRVTGAVPNGLTSGVAVSASD